MMLKIAQENLIGLKVKDYTFVKLIGEGNYGRVYEAFNEKTAETVAAKVVPKELFKRTPKLLELVKNEIRVLKECKNENVVRYVDNFMSEKSVIIVMELCDGGELQQYLDNKQRLTENQATTFLKQIINGFKGLHQIDAMHRDFKAANVLLHQNICKIADLGFAKQVKEQGMTTTILGTGLTMAPEVHQQKAYGRKADIWSVGVVFYQLIYGEYPFKGISDPEILKNIKKHQLNFSKVNISEKARDFIEKCLTIDPKKRISWKAVYSHPLIVEELQIKYGLTSSIKLQENQVFYDRDSQPEEQVSLEKEIEKEVEIPEEVVREPQVNVGQLMKSCEQRIKLQAAIKSYQTKYLNRRNNIMFVFKYIVPYILSIYKGIHANHLITLFILCKKAYQDLINYSKDLHMNTNFLSAVEYFEEFTASRQYKEISELVEGEVELIADQTKEYCYNLPKNLNQDTKNEMDITHIHHQNWIPFVMDTVDCYENELISNLDSTSSALKPTVIKLVHGLYYYRTHAEGDLIEQFEKQLEGLSYEEAELQLRDRWIKKLSEYQ